MIVVPSTTLPAKTIAMTMNRMDKMEAGILPARYFIGSSLSLTQQALEIYQSIFEPLGQETLQSHPTSTILFFPVTRLFDDQGREIVTGLPKGV